MKKSSVDILNAMVTNHPGLKEAEPKVAAAVELLVRCFSGSHRVFVCGNGGSAADAEHIVGELMKSFLLPRKISGEDDRRLKEMYPETYEFLHRNLQQALPVYSLVSETALMTAFSNDQVADLCFAQQVLGYGQPGDVLIVLSTSGNSKNVLFASQIAHFKGMEVIALTGSKGGAVRELADVLINVPSDITFRIQEYHLPVYHAMCAAVENEFFSTEDRDI
jgi:D-sedoheptulose 7-phosphate isomerase